MAPELLCGERAGPRSDIWALGVLLHEMTTRELPFTGHTEYELAAAILHAPPVHCPRRYLAPSDWSSNAASQRMARNGFERSRSAAGPLGGVDTITVGRSQVARRPSLRQVGGGPTSALSALRPPNMGGSGRGVARGAWRCVVDPATSARASGRPAVSGLPVLAVLPFRLEGVSLNLSNQARGVIIADSIIARLSRLRLLRVLQVGSSFLTATARRSRRRFGRARCHSCIERHRLSRRHQYAVDLRLVRTADGTNRTRRFLFRATGS